MFLMLDSWSIYLLVKERERLTFLRRSPTNFSSNGFSSLRAISESSQVSNESSS